MLVSASIICNLIYPDTTNVILFCKNATPGVDFERYLIKLSRQISLSNSRSHNPWLDMTIGRMSASVGNGLGYGRREEERGRIYVSLRWHMTDTTSWHSLIASIIAAFGSTFQEVTSLKMNLDLTVSDSEGSLLPDLLRKFERVELLSCPFGSRLVTILQRTETQILFPLLRKLMPQRQLDVDDTQACQNLMLFLRHRSGIGANITTLYRNCFNFDIRQTRLLKEFGLQVLDNPDDDDGV